MVPVVVMVRVEFCADALVRLTEVGLRLAAAQVMGLDAPVGAVKLRAVS